MKKESQTQRSEIFHHHAEEPTVNAVKNNDAASPSIDSSGDVNIAGSAEDLDEVIEFRNFASFGS